MSVSLTMAVVLALGASPKDPNLSLIHETFHGEDGNIYQYRLVSGNIKPVIIINNSRPTASLCPSRGEGFFGGGRARRIGG